MKIKATALALAIAGVAAAGSAQASFLSESASAFSYDSVGVYYTDIESDNKVFDRDGFGVEGSLSIAPNLFVTGSLEMNDYDNLDRDQLTSRFGAGYHRDLGLSIPTDVVVQAGVTATQDEPDGGYKQRHFAWDSSVGLRTSLGIQGLDASAYLGVVEDRSDDYDFTFAWGVSADYFVTPEFSLGVAYDVKDYEIEDEEALSFGVKYHF